MRLWQSFGALSALALFSGALIAETIPPLESVVITATRESKSQAEVASSVSVFSKEAIQQVNPAHPEELLNRSAGVHVNNLGGEGHMTAIRQPLTTRGVYLFLEDGIPIRPTGLFNHNGLYEVSLPQADRIEVTKGPGSALYGSDSIGGIIHLITRPSALAPEASANSELGSHGWKRSLLSGSAPINEDHGFRVGLNVTSNGGFREESDYSRYAFTNRFDGVLNDQTLYKTLLSYSQVNQSGISSLSLDDYRNNPTKNLYHNDVARRTVDAFRLSTEFAYESDAYNRLTLTPFFRHNKMELMPSWMLSYDPNDRDYQFQSYGMLVKHRKRNHRLSTEWIMGIDVDYSPSTYKEIRLDVEQSDDIYVDTEANGRTNYDFKANQLSVAPYVHGEWQASSQLRLTGGIRYDHFQVDYDDRLAASVVEQQTGLGGFNHQRPDDQSLSYEHFSPKLGMIYALSAHHRVHAHYRHSFRVPSMSQLFRSGSSQNSDELKPVQTDSVELGASGRWMKRIQYQLAIYQMWVQDDIVTYIDSESNDRRVTNAGETQHKGVELDVSMPINQAWAISSVWSLTEQTYSDYTAVYGFPLTEVNYSGNQVGKAPKTLGGITLVNKPRRLPALAMEAEWSHVGAYHTDETNTQRYGGHDLLHIRVNYAINQRFEAYGRVMNVTDERYSVYTSNEVGATDTQYRPGAPLSVFAGIRSQF